MLYLIAVLLTSAARADVVEETLDNPIFGKLAVYHTADEPKGVVLFASGAGGWNAELAAVAREIANLDYTVAGIDSNEYLARLDRSTAACADPSMDLEQLNRSMEQRYPPATHLPPVLLGQVSARRWTTRRWPRRQPSAFMPGSRWISARNCPCASLCVRAWEIWRAPRRRIIRACH